MNVEFYADNPRQKSRDRLDDLLNRGVDQLAIANAFCTGAGAKILMRHAQRLKNRDSFVVVSAAEPTDFGALEQLHNQIPGHLFVHYGALTPKEKKNGAALMHSKVFYARAGDECRLWTGSHNLTGNATQGGNCEAAILLHGRASERPSVDALQHLTSCRDEAVLYDPTKPPIVKLKRAEIVAIHAEMDRHPTEPLPWNVLLSLQDAAYDDLLRPPADVRLFLYPRGSLIDGWQDAYPRAAYAGTLTGLNLTSRNPQTLRQGVEADWRDTHFYLTETGRGLSLSSDSPRGGAATQVMLNMSQLSDPHEILFSEAPKIEVESMVREEYTTPVDTDVRSFFTKDSVRGERLLHQPIEEQYRELRLPLEDTRHRDHQRIREALAPDMAISPKSFSEEGRTHRQRRPERHPYIVRAKYRIKSKDE